MEKGIEMVAIFVIGLLVGITVQNEYNVTQKPEKVKVVQVEVDRPVEVEKLVDRIGEIKIKPKSITCEPKVEY